MVISFHLKNLLVAIISMVVLSSGLGMAAEVEAQLDRESVEVGNGALLTLRIEGGKATRPNLPEIPDFIIQPRGQSQQVQMANGRTTVSLVYSYAVGSTKAGDYEIPGIEVTVDGESFTTEPLKLKVLAGSASQPPSGLNQNQPNAPGQEATQGEDQFGFLTVTPAAKDRKHVYVGEIAPVRIQAWIPADARAQLRSGIQPEAQAFTLHNVSEQPQQAEQIKDGKRYIVLTWFGGISATKAGTYPASLSVKAVVAVRDESAPAPRRQRGGPFDDPFFDSVFDQMNARYIEKDVTLTSRDQDIEVRALPLEGRPDGFTGAVGKFRFDGEKFPAEWKTGEPQQLSVKISGEGNFALMNAPDLTPQELWKTYPGKDDFTPGDMTSFSGSKVFQFSAVPKKGGSHQAGLTLSYFEPDAGVYKTIETQPKTLQVVGNDLVEFKDPTAAEASPEVKPADNLVAQKKDESPVRPLAPLVSRPAFAQWLGVAAALTLLGRIGSWIKRHRSNPARLARLATMKATSDALRAASERAVAKDVAGFFAAARAALQQQLGSLWNQPAQAITLVEVTERISSDSPVAQFFREADLHEYSRHVAAGEMLPKWQQLLDQALKSISPGLMK